MLSMFLFPPNLNRSYWGKKNHSSIFKYLIIKGKVQSRVILRNPYYRTFLSFSFFFINTKIALTLNLLFSVIYLENFFFFYLLPKKLFNLTSLSYLNIRYSWFYIFAGVDFKSKVPFKYSIGDQNEWICRSCWIKVYGFWVPLRFQETVSHILQISDVPKIEEEKNWNYQLIIMFMPWKHWYNLYQDSAIK